MTFKRGQVWSRYDSDNIWHNEPFITVNWQTHWVNVLKLAFEGQWNYTTSVYEDITVYKSTVTRSGGSEGLFLKTVQWQFGNGRHGSTDPPRHAPSAPANKVGKMQRGKTFDDVFPARKCMGDSQCQKTSSRGRRLSSVTDTTLN